MQQKKPAPTSVAAVIVGLLVLAVAVAEAYAAWRLWRYMGRLDLVRGFGSFMSPPEEQQQIQVWLAISQATQIAWLICAWLATFLLGLAGLWTMVRRRFGWRMLWTGAIATILAAGLTLAGSYVLEHYAGFPAQARRIYVIAFLIHSSPGWLILAMWLGFRLCRRQPEAAVALESGNGVGAEGENSAPDQSASDGQSSSPDDPRDSRSSP